MEAVTRHRSGDQIEVEIDALAHGGRGVGRANGYVVFVSGGLPGDRVRARLVRAKRSFAEANATEILRPSSERIGEACVHEGEPCPGAAWQALPYQLQLSHKQEQVGEALSRLGGLGEVEIDRIEPAVEQWRYRNKLEYSFGAIATGLPHRGADKPAANGIALGFHRRGSWSELVDVDDCLLASEANNAARNSIRDWAFAEGLSAYDRKARAGLLRNLVVREGRRTGQLQTRLVTSPGELPRPPVDLHTVVEGPGGGTEGPTGVLGAEHLSEELAGLRFRVSHEAFLQTNTEMAERLYAIVAELAALSGRERIFDLFCGIGTIGLSLAGDAGEVWGLESVERAIADAEENARENAIDNARFVCSPARLGLRPLVERAGRPDLVVIDPPRAGLSAKVVRRVLECEAKRIVYVSCNPTTLAPNAAQLGEAGYTLRRVKPVDMFPQTPHVECVALLER